MEPTPPAPHRIGGKLLATLGEDSAGIADSTVGQPTGVRRDGSSSTRKVELASQFGEGSHIFLRLDEGFYLLITNMHLSTSWATQVIGENLIEFHYRISNILELRGEWGELRVNEANFLLWYQPDGHDDVFETVSDDAREISVGLYCSPRWLKNAFGEGEPLPDMIEKIVEGQMDDLYYRLLPYYPGTAPLLESLVHCTTSGISPIRVHAKALDLLFLSIAAVQNAPSMENSRLRLTDRDVANVERAHDLLSVEFARPPALHVLARQVGLNTTKLPWGFKRQYGVTIQEFIRRRRLERAQELLETTDMQVSQVALEVGYKHHSTFTAAFADHFGFPPKAIVNGRYAYGKVRA